MNGMADIIRAHSGFKSWAVGSEVYTTCASTDCDWKFEAGAPIEAHHAHVADELAKAGYGITHECLGMDQRKEAESGGVRCELMRGHEGGHWISTETINTRLYNRVTLISPQAFASREEAA